MTACVYATDFNHDALAKAEARIYSQTNIKEYSDNYYKAGGKKSLSDYYLAQHQPIIFNEDL